MKYCPYCGATLHDDMAFCPKCGKQYKEGTEETAESGGVETPAVSKENAAVCTAENLASQRIVDSGKKGMTNPLPIVFAALILVALVIGGIVCFSRSDAAVPALDELILPVFETRGSSDAREPEKQEPEAREEPWSVEKATNSVLYLEVCDDADNVIATASGFVFGDQTTVVTNYHVIDGAYHIRAYPANETIGKSENAATKPYYDLDVVLAYSKKIDLALLKCEEEMDVAPIPKGNSDSVKQGDPVYTDGYPLGLANTLSGGMVSSRYELDGVHMIQITAPISSGSSGGALLDESGDAIGVICASYVDGQNLNLAIPIRYVSFLLDRPAPQPLSDFFTPTYSVEYVLAHHEELLGKTFYVYGWVSGYKYVESDKRFWAYIYNSAEDMPYKTKPRDDYYEYENDFQRSDNIQVIFEYDSTNQEQALEMCEKVDTGTCIVVKGKITQETFRYFLLNRKNIDSVDMECTELEIVE